jgi:hypothetical protein
MTRESDISYISCPIMWMILFALFCMLFTKIMAPTESFTSLLARSMDYSEKARVLAEQIADHRFDPDFLLEQIPALLHLLGEISRSDMRDPHGVSPWISEKAAQSYNDIFGPPKNQHRLSVLSFLPRGVLTYAFPIGSLPIHSLISSSSPSELVSLRYFSTESSRTGFLTSRMTVNLPAIDYWFVGFAFLPMIELSREGSWKSTNTNHVVWYDESKHGSVYESVLVAYVHMLESPGSLRRGAELLVGLWCDFVLNPMVFTSGMLNYKRLLRLISRVWDELPVTHFLFETFQTKLAHLLIGLLSPKSFASKFSHRMDMATCRELVTLWVKFVERSRTREVMSLAPMIIQSGPLVSFVSDTLSAAVPVLVSSIQNSTETKLAIGCIIDVIEQFEKNDSTNNSTELYNVVTDAWEAARICTWFEHRVPRNLYEESARMDKLTKSNPSHYSWDDAKNISPDSSVIPRSVSSFRPVKSAVSKINCSWTAPPSSQEYGFLIRGIRTALARLGLEEEKLIVLRNLANVQFVFPSVVVFWILGIFSGMGWVGQIIVLIFVALVAGKLVVAQYIV